jgi:hypothetical protein
VIRHQTADDTPAMRADRELDAWEQGQADEDRAFWSRRGTPLEVIVARFVALGGIFIGILGFMVAFARH